MSEGNHYRDDVHSTAVRAGKRTYFFDVKATRGNDLFMTITESKRTGTSDQGHQHFEKHKIFLYKEDFEKFIAGLNEAIDHIRQLQESGQYRASEPERRSYEHNGESAGDVRFDDLG
ncbi:MAG: DUF3276 family protein [Flavobacteriales bacterium]|jgi:hypothetical protein